MPYLKFDNPNGFANNKGSVEQFVNYLGKEDFTKDVLTKEFFFNQNNSFVLNNEVVEAIDSNRKGLSKSDAKFYTGSINFSEEELQFIGNDATKIKEYTIKVMEQYAYNFNRGITIDNVNWFAKIEYNRYYKGDDDAVISGLKMQGDAKEGLQTHAHIALGHLTRDGKKKISPKTNHRKTQKGPVQGGFDRDEFKKQCERIFDQMFGYLRPLEESYQFYKIKANGSIEEQVELMHKHSNEKVKRESYQNQSIEQKESRIKQLANYICFGIDKDNVKRIDIDTILELERKTEHKGNVYRSLVNLNRMCKQGKTPLEYDLTAKVIGFANFLEFKQNSLSLEENALPVIIAPERNEGHREPANISYSIPDLFTSNHHGEDPADSFRRKKKKKKGQQRDQDMSL